MQYPASKTYGTKFIGGQSEILTETMLNNLIAQLPSHASICNWKRLYKLNEDGKSYIKFYENTKGYDTTVLLIQDQNKYVFGAFVTEEWKLSSGFYGNGAEMLFTFKNTERPNLFRW